MAFPLNAKFAGVLLACIASISPAASLAQTFDAAPSGSFTFGNIGTIQAEALPLEMSPESTPPSQPAPTIVAELSTAPVTNDIQTTRVRSRMIRNTWSIGVFR